MGLLDRMWGWLGARQDAAPLALPGPVEEPLVRRRDSVINAYTGIGDPTIDKGAVTRPNPYPIALNDREIRSLRGFNGLARRIIDLPPSRATRKGWSVPEIGLAEDKRLRTWSRFCEAGQLARADGGALLLMVTEDDIPREFRRDPQRWLEQPLDLRRVGRLHALQLFDASEAHPIEYERDLRQVGYRLPRIWSIGAEGISARVHASRVIHLRGARRPPSEIRGGWFRSSTMPDDSILQAIWDEISRLSITMAGGAILAQELRESVLQVAELPAKQTGDDADAFSLRMKLMGMMKSVLGLILVGPGEKYESRSNPPTGFKELSEAAQKMLCTVVGWPASMLSGEAPGGLSTDDESGLERERQIISDYQEQELRQPLEQLYQVVYAAQDGPTGGVIPDEWEVMFAPLNEPTAQETAELRKLVAETDAIYISSGVYSPADVVEARFGEEGWALDMGEVEPPDPDEEAAVEAARLALEAEGGEGEPDPDEGDEPRDDASPVLPSDAPPELRAAVRKLIAEWPAREEP